MPDMQTAMMARFQTACFAMQILQTMAQVLIRRSSNRVEGRDTTPSAAEQKGEELPNQVYWFLKA
jgi:hypothetical protein